MSDQTNPQTPSMDAYEHLQILLNPDGSLTRKFNMFPDTPASLLDPVPSKDIIINKENNTWVRLFLPPHSSPANKHPLIIHIHGGGFILFSAATNIFHDFCSHIALQLPAVVASLGYRLAPEHRLPAAYDDVVEALHWIKNSDEIWLRDYADLTSCFIFGDSAGGNIAYHAGLRVADAVDDFKPLKIKGLTLHQPGFGGTQRTKSELRLVNDPVLPLHVTDLMWDLSLPNGADRDHEYSNPKAGDGSKILDRIKLMGWKVLITGCDGDPLIDRQIELAELMKDKGIKVEALFSEGGYHGAFHEPSRASELLVALKNFIGLPMAV